ncbi:MAG: hypothetical protein M3547_01425 [Acidobacteriota bacterium]|nr:hypothetical protein [Acidobacteriota bacterium]
MKKVLSALALFLFCSALASAKPAPDTRAKARHLVRPTITQPSLLLKIQKGVTGWIRTFEDPDPPPDDPGRSHGPIP